MPIPRLLFSFTESMNFRDSRSPQNFTQRFLQMATFDPEKLQKCPSEVVSDGTRTQVFWPVAKCLSSIVLLGKQKKEQKSLW